PPDRVVVIPFANITGNTADNWIGIGIAETLTVELERATSRTVIRMTDDRLLNNGTQEAVVSAGRELNVRWIVSGSYQRMGEQLRLTGRLIESTSGDVLRSARIDGRLDELFALQDQLVAELQTGFAPQQERMAERERTATRSTTITRAPQTSPPDPSVAANTNQTAPFTVEETVTVTGASPIDGPPPPVAPATISRDAEGRATVRAVRLTEPLEIDGILNETMYDAVESFSGFIQQSPDEGAPATERTEAWVFFDDSNVYVSGRLWDSAPESQWVANEMQRDSFQLINNESFSVVFDTFYDRRNGLAFLINPLGGIYDYEITDEGRPNRDWNPVWNIKTGRFDGGWTVEMEIPFKSLRFRPGLDQVWGLQLGRRIRWKNESVYLTPVAISAGPGLFRLSAAGTLAGLEVPSGNRTFEIKPYAIGSLATDRNASPAITNELNGNAGVDLKYGVTQNLTADFTYNTDFAQVEVDEQQVNLTRFSLFFPEKREFFLESRGTFDFGQSVRFGTSSGPGGARRGGGFFGSSNAPTVFFSRRIGLQGGQTVPILGGGRLTGKAGDFTVGALNIQTDDALSGAAASTNFTVMRIKRDILRRSQIGGIFTGRSVSTKGPGGNQVYGLDAAFSFYDNVNFTGYYTKSQTSGLVGDDESYQAAFTYNGDLYAFQLDHLLVGDNFNPEIGFMRRDDFRRTYTAAQYSPRPQSLDAIRQFTWGASLDYITTVAGQLETRITQGRFQTELENSDRINFDVQKNYELLHQPFLVASDVAIPAGGYNFDDYFVSYSLGQQRRVAGTVSLQRGEFFSGDITAIGYRQGRLEITPQFSISPGISINNIDLPQGRFTTKLVTSRLTYTLTPRMFFSGLLQYNSSTNALSSNLRLRWEYQPGSELFVVYNDVRDTELRSTPLLQNRAFIIKFTKLFRF
ncbi:uncharacterized protein METZ01_LOCUS116046, partial [marine metagenome]